MVLAARLNTTINVLEKRKIYRFKIEQPCELEMVLSARLNPCDNQRLGVYLIRYI